MKAKRSDQKESPIDFWKNRNNHSKFFENFLEYKSDLTLYALREQIYQ